MPEPSSTQRINQKMERISFAAFLESVPPNQLTRVSDLSKYELVSRIGYATDIIQTSEIQLHCDNTNCNGIRFFRCISGKEQALLSSSYKFF